MASSSSASLLLRQQINDLCKDNIDGFSGFEVVENEIFEWRVTFFGLRGTMYEGGFFNAIMSFPQDFPDGPPTVRFTSEIWHPKVDPDGKVCNSILDSPGAYDTVESVVVSIISMLACPEDDSPAILEAAKSEAPKVEAAVIHKMSVPNKSNICCSHEEEHDLVRKSSTDEFDCGGCKQQGSGPRYGCVKCNFELHEDCMFPKASTSHEFFEGSKFIFFKKPQLRGGGGDIPEGGPERYCDACGKLVLGYNYHCEDKNLDLHPCCSKLKKKICIEDTLFELHKEVLSSRCDYCLKKKLFDTSEKNIPGWSYSPRSGDWHFHVNCMMAWVNSLASIKDGSNQALQKIELKHLVKSTKKNKRGGTLLSTVKIFLTTIISILLGDPTALLASTIVGLVFNA